MNRKNYEEKELIINVQSWLDEQGFLYQERQHELIANSCFHCGKAKKLYINKDTGFWNCFRCGEKGNVVTLVMKVSNCRFKEAMEVCYGKEGPINTKDVENEDWDDMATIKNGHKKSKKEEPADPINLPHYFTEITKGDSIFWEYLKKRGLTDSIIESLPIYVWKDAKRVVFTIETEGEIMGYMARDITGTQDPKTLNSKGNFRSYNVWNYDRVKESDEIIICEGIFSAIKCGIDRTVALLGKVATSGQIALLRKTKAKKIYFCLDIGTEEDQLKLYEQMSIYYPGQIYKIDLPAHIAVKDLNQSSIDTINNKFKTNIKLVNENTLYLSPRDKKSVKQVLASNKLILLNKENLEFLKWLAKSDYKDSGDYSFEEMNKYIQDAKIFKRN